MNSRDGGEPAAGASWDATKFAGALGILIYGALFLAYRSYYDPLNLAPEDVGVTSTFVLVRAIGFVALVLIAAVPPVLAFALLNKWEQDRGRPDDGVVGALRRYAGARTMSREYVTALVLSGCYAGYLFAFFGVPVQGGWFIATTIVLAVVLVLLVAMRWSTTWAAFQWVIALSLIAIAGVLLPLALTIAKAAELGAAAEEGRAVSSFDVFGLPVLDVSAPPVSIVWADPRTPHPPDVFGALAAPTAAVGTLVGQTDNAVYVNVDGPTGHRIIRFDARQVIIQF